MCVCVSLSHFHSVRPCANRLNPFQPVAGEWLRAAPAAGALPPRPLGGGIPAGGMPGGGMPGGGMPGGMYPPRGPPPRGMMPPGGPGMGMMRPPPFHGTICVYPQSPLCSIMLITLCVGMLLFDANRSTARPTYDGRTHERNGWRPHGPQCHAAASANVHLRSAVAVYGSQIHDPSHPSCSVILEHSVNEPTGQSSQTGKQQQGKSTHLSHSFMYLPFCFCLMLMLLWMLSDLPKAYVVVVVAFFLMNML